MKKKWKKLMALILAVTMVLSMSVPTYAGIEDLKDAYEAKALQVMDSLALNGKSDYEKVYTISEWIRQNVSYEMYANNGTGQKHTEYPHRKEGALLDHYAVCDGYAELFNDFAERAGLESYMVMGETGAGHAWNLVKIEDEYYYIDVTNITTDSKNDQCFLFGSNSMKGWYILDSLGNSEKCKLVQNYNYQYYHSKCTEHTWVKGPNSEEASCEYDGYDIYYCSNDEDGNKTGLYGCNAYYKDVDPATGHKWSDWTITQPATCTSFGEKKRICNTCGKKETETIEKADHDYDYENKVSDTRVCWSGSTFKGGITFKCKNCTATKFQPNSGDYKLDHNLLLISDTATCTKAGKKTYICVNPGEMTVGNTTYYSSNKPDGENICGYTKTETSPAKGHDWDETVEYETADCYRPRTIKKECKNCSVVEYVYYGRDGKETEYYAVNHEWNDGEITTQPTCTVPGVKTYTCIHANDGQHHIEYGDGIKTEPVDALGHDFGEWQVETAATCTADGTKVRSCSRCDAKERSSISATGHQHTEVRDASRDYTGDTWCTDCNQMIAKGSEIAHNWDEGVVTLEPTCTEAGSKHYTCTDEGCSAAKDEPIDAKGHAEAVKNKKDATCTETGYSGDTYCTTCGVDLATGSTTPKLAHDYEVTKRTESTCKDEGSETKRCKVCGHEETTVLPKATTHTPESSRRNFKAATCTEKGYTGDLYCKICGGLIEKGTETPVKAHSWNDGTVTKQATCTEKGIKTYTCTACGAIKTEDISAKGHSQYVTKNAREATCAKEGYTGDTCCGVCGTKISSGTAIQKKAHTWNGGSVAYDATCTGKGLKVYTCTGCGATKQEYIKEKGHGATVVRNQKTSTCIAAGYTGDTYCTVCNKVIASGNSIPAKGHTPELRNQSSPSCTANGYTGDTYCSVCNTKLNTGKAIAALGHSFGGWYTSINATAVSEGQIRRDCSRCGHAETQATARLTPTGKLNATNNLPLKVKQSVTLKVNEMAAGDYVRTWTSSNTKIAKVDGKGKVTGVKKGSAKITATLASGKTLAITVKVQTGTVKTSSVTVNTKNVTIKTGGTFQLTASRAPITSSNGITYSSKSTKIATVSKTGKITGKKAGTTYIYVKSGSKKVTVKVKVEGVKTAKLTANATEKTLNRGKSFNWKVTRTPANSSEGITYTTSNKKIATVSKTGKITAKKKKGTATITAKSGSQKVSIKITVK